MRPEAQRFGQRAPLSRRDVQQAALLRMLVRLRTSAGLNQALLACRLNITQSEVSKFERGERALDALRLRDWVRALGADFASFSAVLDGELERLDGLAD